MTTWCFKSALQRTRKTAINQWYWQIDPEHTMFAITSKRLFPTIAECIADARENGFRGEVDVSAEVEHPARINCVDEEYVHAVVPRPMGERSVYRAL